MRKASPPALSQLTPIIPNSSPLALRLHPRRAPTVLDIRPGYNESVEIAVLVTGLCDREYSAGFILFSIADPRHQIASVFDAQAADFSNQHSSGILVIILKKTM
jgi:hypothetical protein